LLLNLKTNKNNAELMGYVLRTLRILARISANKGQMGREGGIASIINVMKNLEKILKYNNTLAVR